MTKVKWYGMANQEILYLGEHDDFEGAEEVIPLLIRYGVITQYGVDWIFDQEGLEGMVKSALEALGTQVLVEVGGGVADITSPDYIPVELIDYDALEEEEMNNV